GASEYMRPARGWAPRALAFPPPGTRPTVYAFSRGSDAAPPPDGGRAILAGDDRWAHCDMRTVMLLPNVLAYQRAREAGAMDAVLVREGLVMEATKANVFAVIGGVLRTAPNGPWILPGVTRGAPIRAARNLGVSVEERAFSVEAMLAAAEVFLASTRLWPCPLVELDAWPMRSGSPGLLAPRGKDVMWREFTG